MVAKATFAANKLSNKLKSFDKIPRAKGFLNRFLPVPLDFIRVGGPPYMHKHIDDRHRELGSIFREKMGPYELISITDTSMIRKVIMNEGSYPETKLPPVWSLYMKIYKLERGLFFQRGEQWLKTRRALDKILLDSSKIDKFNRASWLIAEDLLEFWVNKTQEKHDERQECSKVIELQDFALDLSKWSIENVAYMLFGKRLNCLGITGDKLSIGLVEQANRMLDLSNKLQVLPVELMQKLNSKLWVQFEDSMQKLMQIARSVSENSIQDHENHTDTGLICDIMSTSGLNYEEIVKNMIDFLVAAADTSAASVTWALYLLAKNPDVQIKARREIHSLLRPDKISKAKLSQSQNDDNDDHFWENLNQNLRYIDGFVRETMRLYPPAPFISRQLTKDLVLGDYQIPEGVHVIFPLITTGRMEEHFKNPLKVEPERWMTKKHVNVHVNSSSKPNKLASLPFGLGLRMCIGRKMASSEIKMLLACIVNSYEIKLSEETKPIEIKLRMTTWPSEPIKIQLIPLSNSNEAKHSHN